MDTKRRQFYETYANKLFLYMGFGIPVIVSDCPAQANVINRSEGGLVFKAEDTDDFIAKIKAMDNPVLHERLSKNAFASVKSKYNFSVSKKNLTNLYEQLSDEVYRN